MSKDICIKMHCVSMSVRMFGLQQGQSRQVVTETSRADDSIEPAVEGVYYECVMCEHNLRPYEKHDLVESLTDTTAKFPYAFSLM